jgi:hypothetical protein
MFRQILASISDGLIAAGQSIRKRTEIKPIEYFPQQPIGEIRPRKHGKAISFFWLYYDEEGVRQTKYLARNKEKAIERREELSGFLNQ